VYRQISVYRPNPWPTAHVRANHIYGWGEGSINNPAPAQELPYTIPSYNLAGFSV